jgi:lipopolysaccharide/colanic/teichoic acid biosynthesis glycosyltransferase
MAKRLIDILAAAAVLAALSPIYLAIAVAVCLAMGWPPLFAQTRAGRHGHLFAIYKFRSMTRAVDGAGKPLPDELRLTPLGRFLRRTSLDELPELINVLKGDMSLVGPRPLLPEYLPYYTAEQARRHDMRPGITGLAQISGRNDLSWDERFRIDAWYVDHASLWLDLKIIARTFAIVLRGKGISAPGHATMPRFDDERRNANRP